MGVLNMNKFGSRPVNLLMTHIIVPPISLRPSVAVTPTLKNEDDLTNQIKMIVRCNYELQQRHKNGDDIYQIQSSWYKLQGLVAQFINNDTPGIPFDLKKSGGIKGLV